MIYTEEDIRSGAYKGMVVRCGAVDLDTEKQCERPADHQGNHFYTSQFWDVKE